MACFESDIGNNIDIDSLSSLMTEQYKNNIGQSSGKDIEYADLLYHLEALYR